MLVSSLLLLALGRPCPNSMCVYAKAKTRNQQTSNGKEKMQSAYEGDIKQISMIDLASKERESKQTSEKANKQISE